MGSYSTAKGEGSFALGNCTAEGTHSFALGINTKASSAYSVSLGARNIDLGSKTQWILTDPILTVGIGGPSDAIGKNALTILKNGQVLIGINSALNTGANADTKLAVNGGIYASMMTVKLPTNGSFPDFVFDKDYKLKSLPDVENYIEKNHHLEGIPSAKEVEEKGIDLAEVNIKLLQKVEELTLYLIELNKQNKELAKRLEAVEKK